jgi:hypothetical protein
MPQLPEGEADLLTTKPPLRSDDVPIWVHPELVATTHEVPVRVKSLSQLLHPEGVELSQLLGLQVDEQNVPDGKEQPNQHHWV